MDDKEISDEELEEQIDNILKTNEAKRDVFSILRKEKESLEIKQKRIKDKFKH